MWRSDNWWVSPHNYQDEVRSTFKFPEKVTIHDITLRDGEQQAGLIFNKNDKIQIAKMLDEVGIHRIEAGMPAVSEEDREAIKAITHEGLNAKIFCLTRCMKRDVDLALECGVDGVQMEVPASEHIIKYLYGWPLEKAIKLPIEATRYAADHGLHVAFFTMDSTRTSLDWWFEIINRVATEGHMDSLVLVDTFGVCSPEGARYFVRKIREKIDKPIEAHFHDNFGLAVANTIAACCEGASVLHTTVNGIGEGMGNAALEEVIVALEALYGVRLNLKTEKLYELSKLVQELSKIKVPPYKSVVGDGAYRIESGIVAGWWRRVKELGVPPLAAYPYRWDFVGQKEPQIILAKGSGRDSIEVKLKALDLSYTKEQVDNILNRVKEESTRRKSAISDEEFIEMVKEFTKK